MTVKNEAMLENEANDNIKENTSECISDVSRAKKNQYKEISSIQQKSKNKSLKITETKNLNINREIHIKNKKNALALIKTRKSWQVAKNLDQLEGLDQEVLLKLIQSDACYNMGLRFHSGNLGVLKNFKKLNNDIALALINTTISSIRDTGDEYSKIEYNSSGYIQVIAENLDRFEGLDKTVASAITTFMYGRCDHLANNLDRFKELDYDTALKLIKAGKSWAIIKNAESFRESDHKNIALAILKEDSADGLVYCLENFKGLDNEVALAIFEARFSSYDGLRDLAKKLNLFKGLDYDWILSKFLEKGESKSIIENLKKFKGWSDLGIAHQLINNNNASILLQNIEKFEALYHEEIALALIITGRVNLLIENLKSIKGLKGNSIVFDILQEKYNYKNDAYDGNKSKEIDKADVTELIKAGEFQYIVENLEKFKETNHEYISFAIINAWRGKIAASENDIEKIKANDQEFCNILEANINNVLNIVIQNISKFKRLNLEVAFALIHAGKSDVVIENLEKFKKADCQHIAFALIHAGKSDVVMKNLEKFPEIDHEDLAMIIINRGVREINERAIDVIAQNIEKFEKLNEKIALKFIEANQIDIFAQNIEKFGELSEKIASRLIERRADIVIENLEKFQSLKEMDAAELILIGDKNVLVKILEQFTALNHQQLLKYIIYKSKYVNNIDIVTQNLDKFTKLNFTDIELKLIATGEGLFVAKHKGSYKDLFNVLNNKNIPQKHILELIDMGGANMKELLNEYLDSMNSANDTIEDINIALSEMQPKLIHQYNIGNRLFENTQKLLIDAHDELVVQKKKKISDKLKYKFSHKNYKIRISRNVVNVLDRSDVANLDLDTFTTIDIERNIPSVEFTRKKYPEIYNQVLNSVKKQFPNGDDIAFKEDFLNDSTGKINLAMCNGELITFYGTSKLPGQLEYQDWLIANPFPPVKGLGEAMFITMNKENKNQQVIDKCAVVPLQAKSAEMTMNHLQYIGYSTTDYDEGYTNSYIHIRRLNNEKDKYVSIDLEGEMLNNLLKDLDNVDNNTYLEKEINGTNLRIMKIELSDLTIRDDILHNSNGTQIFKECDKQFNDGFVMTRYIPANKEKNNITYYCIFEANKITPGDQRRIDNSIEYQKKQYKKKHTETLKQIA